MLELVSSKGQEQEQEQAQGQGQEQEQEQEQGRGQGQQQQQQQQPQLQPEPQPRSQQNFSHQFAYFLFLGGLIHPGCSSKLGGKMAEEPQSILNKWSSWPTLWMHLYILTCFSSMTLPVWHYKFWGFFGDPGTELLNPFHWPSGGDYPWRLVSHPMFKTEDGNGS